MAVPPSSLREAGQDIDRVLDEWHVLLRGSAALSPDEAAALRGAVETALREALDQLRRTIAAHGGRVELET